MRKVQEWCQRRRKTGEKELQVALKIAKRSTSPMIQDIEITTILRYTIFPIKCTNTQCFKPTMQGWSRKVPCDCKSSRFYRQDSDLPKCIPIWNAHSWPCSPPLAPSHRILFSQQPECSLQNMRHSRLLLCSTISRGPHSYQSKTKVLQMVHHDPDPSGLLWPHHLETFPYLPDCLSHLLNIF